MHACKRVCVCVFVCVCVNYKTDQILKYVQVHCTAVCALYVVLSSIKRAMIHCFFPLTSIQSAVARVRFEQRCDIENAC